MSAQWQRDLRRFEQARDIEAGTESPIELDELSLRELLDALMTSVKINDGRADVICEHIEDRYQ